MASRAENSSSGKRLSASPAANASSSGDAKPARKVKKPVVKVLKDDEEDTAVQKKKTKPAKAGSSTKPEFQPEKAKEAKPARNAKPPAKDEPSTSSEESYLSSASTARRGHEQAEKSPSTHTTSSAKSPRSDSLGRAILAIERGNLDDFQRLVPKHVPVDSVSAKGRSLLDIARFEKQPEIFRYIDQQLNDQQLNGQQLIGQQLIGQQLIGRAIKAIETVDVDALKKLVPAEVKPDAVSRHGRSLLKIARYQHQQLAEIIKYLEFQTGEGIYKEHAKAIRYMESVSGEYVPAFHAFNAVARGATDVNGKKMRVIAFYDKDSDYYEFTNFYRGEPIKIDGVSWKTVEHYFQAQKFVGKSLALQKSVHEQETARQALKFASRHKADWRPGWKKVRVDVMRTALAAKFGQDRRLRSLLCGTGSAQLVEASSSDDFWGCGADNKGENMLGKLLMELRTELQEAM